MRSQLRVNDINKFADRNQSTDKPISTLVQLWFGSFITKQIYMCS